MHSMISVLDSVNNTLEDITKVNVTESIACSDQKRLITSCSPFWT